MVRSAARVTGIVACGLAIGCVGLTGVAAAKLPSPRTTRIVPGHSIGGVALGMSQGAVFRLWGHTNCSLGVCAWRGPGNPSYAENARVGLHNGKVLNISINAGTTGTSGKFKAGQLATWKDRFGIHLGSHKGGAEARYRHAAGFRLNPSEGVMGFDITVGRITTRFSSFGIGPSPDLLRYVEIYCVPDQHGNGCP
jgi:hypothetical protein